MAVKIPEQNAGEDVDYGLGPNIRTRCANYLLDQQLFRARGLHFQSRSFSAYTYMVLFQYQLNYNRYVWRGAWKNSKLEAQD